MKSRKCKASGTQKNHTTAKGRLLEMIIATMHDAPDVRVERNIRVPTLRNPKRKREIDVERLDYSFQLWFLYDQEAKIRASIPDLVWKKRL